MSEAPDDPARELARLERGNALLEHILKRLEPREPPKGRAEDIRRGVAGEDGPEEEQHGDDDHP